MTDRLFVTDHAVVRYLERVLHLDVDKIREDIRALATDSTPVRSPNRGNLTHCLALMAPGGRAALIIDDERVVTVLGKMDIKRAENWMYPLQEAAE
jgi:hypothetical protein